MFAQFIPRTPSGQSRFVYRHRFALLGALVAVVAACGGGGGGVTGSGASSGAASGGSAATGSTTTTTVALTDAQANAQALANMSATPVNAAVWDLLNAAGADVVRSLVAVTDTVVVSTFKTIADPTGGAGLIKVFDVAVARGTLNGSRVFQLTSGTLPAGSTMVWVNVIGEDFTKNNAVAAESALETTVTALGSALPAPVP